MLAWLMKSPIAIRQIEKWSYDYIKMDCAGNKCYGVLAVGSFSLPPTFTDGYEGTPDLLCPLSLPCTPESIAYWRQGYKR